MPVDSRVVPMAQPPFPRVMVLQGFTKDSQMVYITKRFDIMDNGTKNEMEDFATLVGCNEQADGTFFKYNGCYEDIASAIRKNVSAWMVDMERFFELVVFNYIYANGDDHLKTFRSLERDMTIDYHLCEPAQYKSACIR